MTDAQSRAFKFAYFILGIVVPIAGYVVWPKTSASVSATRKPVWIKRMTSRWRTAFLPAILLRPGDLLARLPRLY